MNSLTRFSIIIGVILLFNVERLVSGKYFFFTFYIRVYNQCSFFFIIITSKFNYAEPIDKYFDKLIKTFQ